ncbi:MAG: endopeptidase La [Desulfuromonadaceae bacterium]
MTPVHDIVPEEVEGAGEYPLLPLRDIVVFPETVTPLFVGRARSISAIEQAMEGDRKIFLVAQNDPEVDDPDINDLYSVGTVASISQLMKLPDGTIKLLAEGVVRARIITCREFESYTRVEVEFLEDVCSDNLETTALCRSVREMFSSYAGLSSKIPAEVVTAVEAVEEPGNLADTIMAHLNVSVEDKQEILELPEVEERLEAVLQILEREEEILKVEQKIRKRVKGQMERTQKEYYLNEQMRAIQKELGDKDEFKQELKELEANIEKSRMSAAAKDKAKGEMRKLKMMSPMSAEATVVRNYLECLLDLPWKKTTRDCNDIALAHRVLDEDHAGLEKVKERILEHLAVQLLVKKIKGPILCLVGPPGVGKTSMGRSIARAMKRKFVRISLGGVRDEAEIRGHRRTYIGAMPGKIMQGIKKAGVQNPVFLLDEIDKMSMDFRGDPSSAMLEVLDPEQNSAFGDHFIDLDFDLSQVMFIATANSMQDIPSPLLDRMELVRLEGYSEEEKIQICRRHLIRKQVREHGLDPDKFNLSDNALSDIIRRYTREAGVRDLERRIAAICRKVARQVAEQSAYARTWNIGVNQIEKYLGVPPYTYGQKDSVSRCGIATGLAWTPVGGDILMVEVLDFPGKGKLSVTGKLGDVMQESAQAAYAYIRSKAEKLELSEDFYRNLDIHIHVPEGSIPKDGPSAGITIATALASSLTKRPVDANLGMTGEINLRGEVLAIGGLKEKLLAARRAGLKRVLIPAQNERHLTEVPAEVKRDLQIHLVSHMDDVLAHALLD